MTDGVQRGLQGVCAVVLLCAALQAAAGLVAPMACALFATALAWPLQRALQGRLPKLLALAITVTVCIIVVVVLGSMVVWGMTRVGQWLVSNAARFQGLYQQKAAWLMAHDIALGGVALQSFDVAWLIRSFQRLTAQLQGFLRFMVVTFVFLMLGLLEVTLSRDKLMELGPRGRMVLRAATLTGEKFRRYMLIRTLMSVLTGLVVWAFARVTGLELATEWGVIAFALNYIPFLGPLLATVLPTLLAVAQFELVQSGLVVFLGMNVIQFIIGSYIEPRTAGATLSLSPVMVLFAVFFGSMIWGIAGAFLGVPVLIAVATLCAQMPSGQWAATLLAGTAVPLRTEGERDAGHDCGTG